MWLGSRRSGRALSSRNAARKPLHSFSTRAASNSDKIQTSAREHDAKDRTRPASRPQCTHLT
eukprot:10844795-Alexandrium_andersonii.AAC.1